MTESFSDRYYKALAAIDAAHADDPTLTTAEDKSVPYELHYARKSTAFLDQRFPEAGELLRLAVRAQHLRRWEVPRTSFPMTKPGYHSWRTHLKRRQADMAADMCREAGYSTADADRVASLVNKEDLKRDADVQALEDVACLVFLDDQFEDFEKHHDEDKIIGILRKTWAKMSPDGQQLARSVRLTGRPAELLATALAG